MSFTSEVEPLIGEEEEDAFARNHSLLVMATLICMAIGTIVVIICRDITDVHIHDVYVPTLDTSTSTGNGTAPFNASIFVDLKYERKALIFIRDIDEYEVVVYYGRHRRTPAASCRIRAFSMGAKMTVHKIAAMEAPELPWEEAFRAVSDGSTVELMVELWSIIEMDKYLTYVAVDSSGHMVSHWTIGLV